MIFLISGASHTGKTKLAQTLLETYQYPYLSIDLLKMGLIRSGNTDLTPDDDEALTDYLWPIVREIIKTAIENAQNLIVEGCYILFNWKADFNDTQLSAIRSCCLVMSQTYIRTHFEQIKQFANVIERRLDDRGFTMEAALAENARALQMCEKYHNHYILIDGQYQVDFA